MKLFRPFRLDPASQCPWRGERRVPLTPKAFDVLRYLVKHPELCLSKMSKYLSG
jgi:DNA-binding response OmpR family regulator